MVGVIQTSNLGRRLTRPGFESGLLSFQVVAVRFKISSLVTGRDQGGLEPLSFLLELIFKRSGSLGDLITQFLLEGGPLSLEFSFAGLQGGALRFHPGL